MCLTFGGYPESEALHWDGKTYHKIGTIVYLLMSGNAKKAQAGYQEFFELKRHFMEDEFDATIKNLDDHRRDKGFKTLTEMVDLVGKKIVENGEVIDIEKQPEDIPTFSDSALVLATSAVESVEQMSLF